VAELDGADSGDPRVFSTASEVLRAARKTKSEARLSMRAELSQLTLRGTDQALALFRNACDDVQAAGRINHIELITSSEDELVAEVSI
jgi:valyl-tRNA synthetase